MSWWDHQLLTDSLHDTDTGNVNADFFLSTILVFYIQDAKMEIKNLHICSGI